MKPPGLIDSHKRDLGGFSVRRVLPAESRQMVGPFIFFDHLGPTKFAPGSGIDVRPHPHIALATVTYLFEGSLEHRDSLGTIQEIRPGDVNWMSAGHGIAHSERTPRKARAAGEHVHGIQSWVALPDGQEDIEPGFEHHPADTLPTRSAGGIDLTVIAGEAFGLKSPVTTRWPTLYAHALIGRGAVLDVPADHEERAVYVAQGEVAIDGVPAAAGQLAVLTPGSRSTLLSQSDARVMILGGAHFPTPRFIWWNFVASSRERIENAKNRWERQEFPGVPGETELMPLPG